MEAGLTRAPGADAQLDAMETTRNALITLLLAGLAGAQQLPTNEALRAAIAQAELRHDEAGARAALERIAVDPSLPDAVRREAWLHAGRLARRLGDEDGARGAFERAAAGDDAVAGEADELLREGPQDPERARQLRERAEVAFEEYIRSQGQGRQLRDLVWFGDTAARVLIADFRRIQGEVLHGGRRQLVVRALWALDSEVGRGFLAEQLGAADPELRRSAVAHGLDSIEIPAAHLPLLRRTLADEDGETVALGLAGQRSLAIEDLAPKIADPRVVVRLAALGNLNAWIGFRYQDRGALNEPERQPESAAIAQHLTVPLAATDPQEFRLAVDILVKTAAASIEGRGLLARSLTTLGDATGYVRWPERVGFAGPNENAEVLRVVLEDFGPIVPTRPVSAGQSAAAALIQGYLSLGNWDRGALDAALTAARLGYIRLEGNWLDAHAEAGDVSRIVEALADSPALEGLTGWLLEQDLPESCFEALHRVARRRLSTGADGPTTSRVLLASGATGHPEAAGFLREVAARPDGLGRAAALEGLVHAGQQRGDAATRDALRGALLTLEPGNDYQMNQRAAMLFGTLIRVGDLEIWDHADALRSKIRTSIGPVPLPSLPGVGNAWKGHEAGPALGTWLAVARTERGARVWWHGYAAADLERIWAELLAPTADGHGRNDWDGLVRLVAMLGEDGGRDGFTPGLMKIVCEAVRVRSGTDADFARGDISLGTTLLAPETRALWQDQPEVLAALDAMRAELWTAPSPTMRQLAAQTAPLPLDAHSRAALVRLLGDAAYDVAQAGWNRLGEAGAPIDGEMVASGLSSSTASVRLLALSRAVTVPAGLTEVLRPALRDPWPAVRAYACTVLGATLELAVVPDLLEALRDTDQSTRDAARAALESIRFYHDEKAHWDRVFAGRAGLTAASAAEALLDQARPGNDPATRLLAIRSLAILGAPETLPFLITWTKDEDAEIAAAARAALATLHAK
jgi:hypothetical protein